MTLPDERYRALKQGPKEEYEEKQKVYEEKIKPVMMKLYEKSGAPGSTGVPESNESESSKGPKVEEVD